MSTQVKTSLSERLATVPWQDLRERLSQQGFATTGPLLSPDECEALKALYAQADRFRSRIVMARYGFGQGEYQYFRYPLPESVQTLRSQFYSELVAVANQWQEQLGLPVRFPEQLKDFLARCHDAGQMRPTPLLIKYGVGDYNCLHQDLYGEHQFPIQLTLQLSRPGQDFSGGEFVLVQQRPRRQSKVQVVSLTQGEAVLFAVNHLPAQGQRSFYRTTLKHGVSPIVSGERYSAGIIFHDAK